MDQQAITITFPSDPAYYASYYKEFATAFLYEVHFTHPHSAYPCLAASWWINKNKDKSKFENFRYSSGFAVQESEKFFKYLDVENAAKKERN